MTRRQVQIVATAGLLLGCAGAWWFHFQSGIEWSVEAVRLELDALGPVGPILFATLVAMRPFLLLPSWLFLVAGGILFGTLWGTVWSSLGTLAGAIWVYGVARGLARDAVERRLSGAIARVDERIGRHGLLWMAAYTAMPATPLTPAFAAAGLSSLKPAGFLFGSTLGVVPRCALYTFFAASMVSGDRSQVIAASVLLAVALLIGWLGRRLWLGSGSVSQGS